MANMYFNFKFERCTISTSPKYLYIDNVQDFLQECGDEYICDDVQRTGVYQWNGNCEEWEIANSEIDKKIRAIVERFYPHQENNNKNIKWNILVTLNTNVTIKINSEPVSINEIHEAIDTLLKPSFFGKRIKKFQIVAE